MKSKWLPIVCVSALLCVSAVAWAESRLPSTDVGRAQLVEWIRNNNKWGPDHQIVKDMGDQVASDVDNTNVVELTLGKGLTRAGRTAQLCLFAGEFFVFELTDEQAAAGDHKPMSVGYTTGTKNRDKREIPPLAKLSKLSVNNVGSLKGNEKVTGTVSAEVTGAPPKNTALRLTWMAGKNTRSMYIYPTIKEGTNDLSFEFKPLNEGNEEQATKGPVVLYVDLCTVNADGGSVSTNLLGNTVAALADVQ